MSAETWGVLLLAAAALHAGFQLTVTLVTYPALVVVPAGHWREAHARHSRGIAPLVALVYGAALVCCLGATLSAPSWGTWVADAGTLLAFAVTATAAAPTHGRLGAGPEPALLRRLLVVDRVRSAEPSWPWPVRSRPPSDERTAAFAYLVPMSSLPRRLATLGAVTALSLSWSRSARRPRTTPGCPVP